MKDSGIEWIGEIPVGWDLRKLGHLLKNIGSGTTPKNNTDYYNGEISWLNTGDLNDGYISHIKKTVSELAVNDLSALKVYPENSVVIALYGATIGKLGIITVPTTTNQACCVMTCGSKLIPLFLYYSLFGMRPYILTLSYGAGQPNISANTIRFLSIVLPSLPEQNRIASFLDKKCAGIDDAIENQRASIEKLKEFRQAVITEAVTKGLNPDVPMKDSGVEWIGEIPEEWGYYRIKYNTYLKGRIGWQGLKASEFQETGPYLITGTDFENGKINWNKSYHISLERYNEAPEIHLKNCDLIITKDGTVGKLAYIDDLPDKASMNSHLLVIRPLVKDYINLYLFWILSSDVFSIYTKLNQDGTIMASLSQEKINNFNFPLPPIKDQNEIAAYLDKKCTAIDLAVSKKENLIEKLGEYKKSLIYEAVTGKIEVSECSV